jgi:Phosphopantetheine attachment site
MSDTLTSFTEEMKRMLAVKSVDVDAPLSQLGVDSLNIVEMVIICQQIYVNVLNYEDIAIDETTTIRELDEQLNSLSVPKDGVANGARAPVK